MRQQQNSQQIIPEIIPQAVLGVMPPPSVTDDA
jgi:hypothetical protein